MTKTQQAAAEKIQALASRDDYLGYGYPAEREVFLSEDDPECLLEVSEADRRKMVAAADARIVAEAAAASWTDQQLFEWLNSKLGRWFADIAFHSGGSAADALERAVWSELRLISR